MKTSFQLILLLLVLQAYKKQPTESQSISLPKEVKFKMGDNMDWANQSYNDSDWEIKSLGKSWATTEVAENVYAWYRIKIMIPFKTDSAKKTEKRNSSKPKIIAHRGAWKKLNLPQNSIASLRQAIKLKFYGSEFDVRMTTDDSLIINHDPTFFDMEIEKSTYAELIEHKLSNGEKLPTLREYILSGIHKNKKTKLICEIKPSGISKERSLLIAQKAHQQIQRLKAQDKVIYISFSYAVLKKIIELDPNASTQYLGGDVSPEQLKIDGISGLDYQISKIKNRSEWLYSAKENKITLNAWTVNKVEDMDWVIQNSFDFITTDEPEFFMEKLKNY